MDPSEDTVEAALRAAERVYEEEDARFRHTDQKTIALLAFAGVLLTIVSRALTGDTSRQVTCLSRSLVISGILGLSVAVVLALVALLPRWAFSRIETNDLSKDASLSLSAVKLKRFLLARYIENIDKNSKATDLKLTFVAVGFWFVLGSLLIVALEGIVRLAL